MGVDVGRGGGERVQGWCTAAMMGEKERRREAERGKTVTESDKHTKAEVAAFSTLISRQQLGESNSVGALIQPSPVM